MQKTLIWKKVSRKISDGRLTCLKKSFTLHWHSLSMMSTANANADTQQQITISGLECGSCIWCWQRMLLFWWSWFTSGTLNSCKDGKCMILREEGSGFISPVMEDNGLHRWAKAPSSTSAKGDRRWQQKRLQSFRLIVISLVLVCSVLMLYDRPSTLTGRHLVRLRPGLTCPKSVPNTTVKAHVPAAAKSPPSGPSSPPAMSSSPPSMTSHPSVAAKLSSSIASSVTQPSKSCQCAAECAILQELSKASTSSSAATACQKNGESVPVKTDLSLPITLVTGYYAIPSKHPPTVYFKWMSFFLYKIKTPIALYTNCASIKNQPAFVNILRQREKLFPGRLHADIIELEQTPLSRQFGPLLKKQEARDRERGVGHNYLLYLVWLMKTEALMQATRDNVYCSEWFMWVDIGVFRAPTALSSWPSVERLKTVPNKRILLELIIGIPGVESLKAFDNSTSIEAFLNGKRHILYKDHLAGGFIGFNIREGAHRTFYQHLTTTYTLLASYNFMIVKDQAVFHALLLMHPELFALVSSRWDCGDGWFYMVPWLADPKEQFCKSTLTNLILTWVCWVRHLNSHILDMRSMLYLFCTKKNVPSTWHYFPNAIIFLLWCDSTVEHIVHTKEHNNFFFFFFFLGDHKPT